MNQNLKVLIVDDNAKMRSMIASIIKRKTNKIFECSDGIDALGEYSLHRPDWVLMDVQMNKMDGLTATGLIHERFPNAKVMIVTGDDTAAMREAAQQVGASAFVAKENLFGILDSSMNGTVKVVLVCGFSVVFGFYASMIQGNSKRIMDVGDRNSYYAQAQMNATAGLNHAIYNMQRSDLLWYTGLVNNNLLVGGDTVSYVVTHITPNDARVTVTGKFGGVVTKQIAFIKKSGPTPIKIQIVKVYDEPYQLPISS
jgi:CheY-like chemotaxis protein